VPVALPSQVVHAKAVNEKRDAARRPCDGGLQPVSGQVEVAAAYADGHPDGQRVAGRRQVIAQMPLSEASAASRLAVVVPGRSGLSKRRTEESSPLEASRVMPLMLP